LKKAQSEAKLLEYFSITENTVEEYKSQRWQVFLLKYLFQFAEELCSLTVKLNIMSKMGKICKWRRAENSLYVTLYVYFEVLYVKLYLYAKEMFIWRI